MHGGSRLARRRGRQDREPEDGRSCPAGAAGKEPRRPVVFPHVQCEQEIAGDRSQVAARAGHRQGAAEEGRRRRREHGAGHDRAPGPRLRRGEETQPGPHLLLDPGVRHRQPVREGAGLRHDRAGRRRPDQRHRRDRSAAGQARPELRRHRHRDADGDHDSGGAVRAPADRSGAAPAGRHAGRDAALHAHLLRGAGAHREGRRNDAGRRPSWAATRPPASSSASPSAPTTGSTS